MKVGLKDIFWFLVVIYIYIQVIGYFKNIMFEHGIVFNSLYIFFAIVLFITMRYTYIILENGTTRKIIIITLIYFVNPIIAIFGLTTFNPIHLIVIINTAYLLVNILKGEI